MKAKWFGWTVFALLMLLVGHGNDRGSAGLAGPGDRSGHLATD